MTSTEVVTDPFGAPGATRLNVGDRVSNWEHYNDRNHGIWTDSGYIWCGTDGPSTSHACSRPHGHPGNWVHVAASLDGNGRSYIREIWGGAVTGDPMAHVAVGVRTNTIADWNHPTYGLYDERTDNWCREPAPESASVCSRPAGHSLEWAHVACTRSRVLHVWGGGPAPDPFEGQLSVGGNVTSFAGWDSPRNGLHVSRRCDAVHPSGAFTEPCKRPQGHPTNWQCVGSDSSGRIEWIAKLEEVDVLQDPEDGTPEDPETAVYTTKPEIGGVVRLRDRENRLYVMGHRTESDEVEVLDLKRDEMRAIPTDRTVVCDVPLTVAELSQVAKWYAKHREAVRKIAVREYRKDRWCMAGLNENLRTLGLEPYTPVLSGTIQVSVPFEYPDSSAGQTAIEDRVRAALAPPEVAAALRVALPPIPGVEIDPLALTVTATNFSRK